MTAHTFHPSILRAYDIRGIVGETLQVADARALGQVFGSTVRDRGGERVVVGYDGRLTSPDLEAALVEGLVAAGIQVTRIGMGPTPMLYFAAHELDADGAIMVTGSHNPPSHNGFKMLLGKDSCHGDAILALGERATADNVHHGEGGAVSVELQDRYVARILKDAKPSNLKVAWDPGNGASGDVVRDLVRQLPGEHILINEKVDGTFPSHHPDPTVEANLEQLKDVVAAEGCDLGVGFDGDGDRIGAIDRHGRVVWGDQLLAILSEEILAELPGAAIIADVKASQALFERVSELGGEPVMWKTGHSLIKSRMKEMGAPLAGEMSGHIFFKHKFYGFDDAVYVAVRLLNAINAAGGDLAAIRDGLPELVNTPELRFDCPDERKFDVVEAVVADVKASGANVNDIDGARVLTDDGWWLLRASNTQACLVARAEAKDEAGLARLKAALVAELGNQGIDPPEGL